MFSASFTNLSIGVQTAASVPFASVLQEIFTGGGVVSKIRVPPLEDTQEGARISGRNIWHPPWGRSKTFVPSQVVGGSVAISVEVSQESCKKRCSSWRFLSVSPFVRDFAQFYYLSSRFPQFTPIILVFARFSLKDFPRNAVAVQSSSRSREE